MEVSVIYCEIIYISASKKCLNCIKDFIEVYSHFFAFITINWKLIVSSAGIEKSYCPGDFRAFIGCCHKNINISFERLDIIIVLALLKLKSKPSRSTKTRNGRRSYNDDVCFPYHCKFCLQLRN